MKKELSARIDGDKSGTSYRLLTERAAMRLFGRLGLLDGLDPAARRRLAGIIPGRLYGFNPGDEISLCGCSIWFLMSGSVILRDESGAINGSWRAPMMFGEEGVLGRTAKHAEGSSSRAAAIMQERASALEICPETIEALESAGLGIWFWKGLARLISERPRRQESPKSALEKPRQGRYVVMFTDVVGFSRIAEKITPVLAAGLLRRIMTAQASVIESHGGQVERLMGDGLMAYWEVGEKDAGPLCAEALASAVEAAHAIGAIDDPTTRGRGMALRIGLHLGEAARGDIGEGQPGSRTLIGDAVNIACRMEQARLEQGALGRLAPVRASEAFFAELPQGSQAILPQEGFATIKGAAYRIMSGPGHSALEDAGQVADAA